MRKPPAFRPPVPVICVGNFVVGGAGKTPVSLEIARRLQAAGRRPGFVGSGYGGSAAGPTLVDPARHAATEVGDEALLLAAAAPTVVCRDRAAAARRLLAEGVDVVVMDDGFQNPSLAKDLSLVCVDAGAGIGNGMVVPSGPLRAPFAGQLARSDAVILIGESDAGRPVAAAAREAGKPLLGATLVPPPAGPWLDRPILAFAGIGRPRKFFDSLAAIGAPVMKTRAFGDHHPFTEAEAAALLAEAERDGLRLVTTTKDMARLSGAAGASAALRARAEAFPVTLSFADAAAIDELLARLANAP